MKGIFLKVRANRLGGVNPHPALKVTVQAGSAGELGRRRGLEQLGFWRKIQAHPNYDEFWRDQAVGRVLADEQLSVPTAEYCPVLNRENK